MRAVRSTRPGYADPSNPWAIAKQPASQGAEAVSVIGHGHVAPEFAAAVMHNDLSDDERNLMQGYKPTPLPWSQVPTEGSDTNETEGDGSVRDPTGQGFGT